MVLCTSKDKATLYKETENKLIRPTTPTFSSPHACETRLIGCWTSSVFQGVEALNSISKDKQFEPSTDAHRKQGVECGFDGFKISIFMIRLSKYPCSFFSLNVKNVHLICASSHHLSVASLTLVKFQPCEPQRSTAGEIQQCQLYGFSRGFSKVGGTLLDMLPELELLFASLQREKTMLVASTWWEMEWEREIWAWISVPTELIISPTESLAQFSRNRNPVHSPPEQNQTDVTWKIWVMEQFWGFRNTIDPWRDGSFHTAGALESD